MVRFKAAAARPAKAASKAAPGLTKAAAVEAPPVKVVALSPSSVRPTAPTHALLQRLPPPLLPARPSSSSRAQAVTARRPPFV